MTNRRALSPGGLLRAAHLEPPPEEIERLASKPVRAADICRMTGELAEEQGLRRPSYEQVRLLVRAARRRPRRVSNAEVLLDVALRARHPDAVLRHVSGTDTLRKSK